MIYSLLSLIARWFPKTVNAWFHAHTYSKGAQRVVFSDTPFGFELRLENVAAPTEVAVQGKHVRVIDAGDTYTLVVATSGGVAESEATRH